MVNNAALLESGPKLIWTHENVTCGYVPVLHHMVVDYISVRNSVVLMGISLIVKLTMRK